MPAGSAEGRQRRLRVILTAIEAPIDERLDAAAHGQDECGDGQRGDDEDERRLAGLPAEVAGQGLQADDQPSIDGAQQTGEQAIDQHPVDEAVNLPQAIA
jgi:hypothetical protein